MWGLTKKSRASDLETPLTKTQEKFVAWNAERLKIDPGLALERYRSSLAVFSGGHGGAEYRAYNDKSYQTYRVFFDDTPEEVFAAYQFHAEMHFLRMLSYPDVSIPESDVVAAAVRGRSEVNILDFGCGLAPKSRALAAHLEERGVRVTLHLADIPSSRKNFLLWMLEREGIRTEFHDCTSNRPIPALPLVDICFATEFFEHVHEPQKYADAIVAALNPGGFLVTNLSRHQAEFMHVHPDLEPVRLDLLRRGLEEIEVFKIYRVSPTAA